MSVGNATGTAISFGTYETVEEHAEEHVVGNDFTEAGAFTFLGRRLALVFFVTTALTGDSRPSISRRRVVRSNIA